MDYRIPQEKQTLRPVDYAVRICVNGSRYWNDKRKFHRELVTYLEQFEQGTEILFISGAARTGADDFIIQWCLKFGFPCKKMEADWDTVGKAASFIRNGEMACLTTHLLSFWDGESVDTKHLIDCCLDKNIPVKVIRIAI